MSEIDEIKKWVDENFVVEDFMCSADGTIVGAEFVTQPPKSVRKSNFFNFTINLLNSNQQPVTVESASFLAFCEDETKNGVQYSLCLQMSDQIRVKQRLLVRLVDSVTKELVRYDTNSRNTQSSDLQRVLVTHRAICSRCSEGKVCGHKNETPSNPIIINDSQLKFFLKCNQNCVKGPGNPTSSRRFQLLISLTEEMDVLCISQIMFVHNNSKHAKAKNYVKTDNPTTEDPKTFPNIIAISPSEGWTMGGQTIIIIGDNFRQGLQVIFGSIPVLSQVITSHAIRVQSPPVASPGAVPVTLALAQHQYNLSNPGTFTYISPSQPGMEQGFSRLARVVPRYQGDPARLDREVVLERAAQVAEAFYSLPVEKMMDSKEEVMSNLLVSWQENLEDEKEI